MNLIAGLEKPTEGEILLNGKPVTGPGADRVVMFQEHALFPWLNVIQNVKFGMEIAGVPKEEQEEKAMKYLRMMQLEDYADYAVHQLSGGMRQRVALARAFTLDSEILLMDEPFSALDKQTSNRLRKELQDIWMQTGKTIFFITHSVEEAVYLGDRVVVMSAEKGNIQFSILWFGLTEQAIIFVVIMGSAFSMAVATDNAIQNVPPIYKKAALTMGANQKQIYWKVILPASLPELISGLKQGWSFAWRALMSGEVMTTCIGLGQTLSTKRWVINQFQ